MEHMPPPAGLTVDTSFDGTNTMVETWRVFKESYELYMIASGGETKPLKVQQAVLKHLLGVDGRKIYNTYADLMGASRIQDILAKFTTHFQNLATPNKTFQRHVFRNITQRTRTIDEFLEDAKTVAKKCDFGDRFDQNVCDQVIFGIADLTFKKKMLAMRDVTLDKVTMTCKTHETVARQIQEMYATADSASKDNSKKRLQCE
jgi:hypothetical protein